MPSIVVVGSVGIDTIETPEGCAQDVVGGSATHFALAAAFHTQVAMVGVVGPDYPEAHRGLLTDRGVDLAGLALSDAGTFRWHGRYHQNLNHRDTVEIQLNAYEDWTPAVPEGYRRPRILFLANIGPDTQRAVLDQVEGADLVALDTMELWIETQRPELMELLQRVDVLFLNEDEARHLTGEANLVEAGRKVLGWGPSRVVVKKGSHGALLFHGEDVFCAPAYPHSRLVDPTGAGDSFAGGFLGYLAAHGWADDPDAFRRAVVHGSILGSVNVEDFASTGIERLERAEIEARYRVFQDITRF